MIMRILKAMLNGAKKEYAEIQKNKRTDVYYSRYVEKWNRDLDWINAQISDENNNTYWYWGQLLQQEFRMWSMIAKPIDMAEINLLSEIRGFNKEQKQYIVNMTKYMGLLISDEKMKAIKDKERMADEKKYASYEKKAEEKAA